MSNLEAALEYAGLGLSVFPVARDKTPRVGKGGYHLATTDVEVIRNHWGEYPDDNIAMPLRPNGFIGVDVDPRNGGDLTFVQLEAAYGALPRTMHAISGSGGQHILMRDIADRRPRGRLDYLALGKGVDVKCNGYILVEPSVHASGGVYTWQVFDPLTIVPAIPERWVELLYHPPTSDTIDLTTGLAGGEGVEQWSTSTDGPLTMADALDLRAQLKALGQRKSGNSTTFKAVRRIFHDYGLSVVDGWPYLVEWNEDCGAPHPQHELERRINNAATVEADPAFGQRGHARKSLPAETRIVRAGVPENESDRPAVTASIVTTTAEGQEYLPSTGSLLSVLPNLPPPVEHAPGSYAAALTTAVDDVAAYTNAAPDGDFATERPFFKSARALFGYDAPPPTWLVDGLIIEGGIGVVATEPKSAKTWLATELALAVATGTDAIGKYKTKPGAVAYFYTEDLEASIKTRVRALLKGRGLGIEAIARTFHGQPRDRAVDVTKLEDCARLIASTRLLANEGGPVKLLVLDPLRNIHTSEEDKADAMSAVFRNLRMIGTLLDCTVLLVHHSAKASENSAKRRPGQRMRGSGAIHGFVDSGIYLEDLKTPDPGTFINVVKSEVKAARGAGVFELTLNIVDDPKTGTAVKASWSVGDIGTANATESQVDTWRDVALELVDAFALNKLKGGGSSMTTREVFTQVKGGTNAKMIAIKLAANEGWLRQDKRTQKYSITPAGEAISKERHTKADDAPVVVDPAELPPSRWE